MSAAVVVDAGAAQGRLDKLAGQLAKPRELFRTIAGILESETETNFAEQGRPAWVPMAKATKAARLKRNRGGSVLKLLQDRGTLAASVRATSGKDFALIGANTPYAAAQQFGAKIEKAAQSRKVRLRTDAKGRLMRQGKDGKLAIFAKDRHKRARETWAEVKAHSIELPARPYLPFVGSATGGRLQPEAEKKVLAAVMAMLGESLE